MAAADDNNNEHSVVCVGIVSHHLFDHKPDNLLAKGGTKYNLRGYYRFGTPGVAVVFGTPDDIDNYVVALKNAMPQKKFEIRFHKQITTTVVMKEWKEADLGGLREALAGLGLEDCFFQVTGLDPSKATDNQQQISATDKGGSKQSSKGKKKKRK